MSALRSSLKPLYVLCLVFGVTPFIWTDPKLKPVCELLIVSIVALFHSTINIVDMVGWVLVQVQTMDQSNQDIGQLIYLIIKLLYSGVNLLAVLVSVVKRRDYRRTIESLECCDRQLMKLRLPLDYRGETQRNVTLLLVSNVIVLVYITICSFVYHGLQPQKSVAMSFLRFFFKYIFMELLSLYAIMVQGAILTRFQAVNQGLRQYFIHGTSPEAEGQVVLLSLASIHDQLTVVYKTHSSCIAIQVGFIGDAQGKRVGYTDI